MCAVLQVIEVQDLEHLESLIDKAGSSLVVVCFYTRSCGACKALLKEFLALCEEAKAQQARCSGDCWNRSTGMENMLGREHWCM